MARPHVTGLTDHPNVAGLKIISVVWEPRGWERPFYHLFDIWRYYIYHGSAAAWWRPGRGLVRPSVTAQLNAAITRFTLESEKRDRELAAHYARYAALRTGPSAL